jgi:hypothetical protein
MCLTNSVLEIEDAWGSGCMDPNILDLGCTWRSLVSFTLGRFTPGKRAPVTRWIGGWVGPRTVLDDVGKRKMRAPCRNSNSDPSAHQPVAGRYTDSPRTGTLLIQF